MKFKHSGTPVPMSVKTITELHDWFNSQKPVPPQILIYKRSPLRKIKEFSQYTLVKWMYYRGIKVVYL